jgi:hypothetical protein
VTVNSRGWLALQQIAAENRSGHWRQADRWPTRHTFAQLGAAQPSENKSTVDGVAMQCCRLFLSFCHSTAAQLFHLLCTSFKLVKKKKTPAAPPFNPKMNELFSLSGNVALQQQTLLSAFTAAPYWPN